MNGTAGLEYLSQHTI